MYKIEEKDYGYKLTFGEMIHIDEMKNWVADSKEKLTNSSSEFGIFVDMQTLKPLDDETQEMMQSGQKLYKEKGMLRSVVIISKSLLKMQFERLAKESGIYEWERYIDSSSNPNWEQDGIDWISKEVDPDL